MTSEGKGAGASTQREEPGLIQDLRAGETPAGDPPSHTSPTTDATPPEPEPSNRHRGIAFLVAAVVCSVLAIHGVIAVDWLSTTSHVSIFVCATLAWITWWRKDTAPIRALAFAIGLAALGAFLGDATVMDGARIGANSVVAGHAIVTEGSEFPESSIIAGIPAKRVATRDNSAANLMNAAFYHQIARDYEAGIERLDPEIFERLMRKIR